MKQLTDEARANLSAAALRREAKKREQKAALQAAPSPQAQPEVMQAPLPVARPDHQALMPLPGDKTIEPPSTPTKPAKKAQSKEPSLPRRALLQSIGVAQTDNPDLREAWSRVAQADRTIGQLRSEVAKRDAEAEELRTEAKRNKVAWENARGEAVRFQTLLGQIGEVAGVYPKGRTEAVAVEAVRHLRQRADRALELEQQASAMNARAQELEDLASGRLAKNQDYAARITDLEDALTEAEADRTHLNKEVGQLRREAEGLGKEITHLNGELESKADELDTLLVDRDALQVQRDQALSNAEHMCAIADALSDQVDQLPTLRAALALCLVALIPSLGYCLLHWFGGLR